MSFLSSRFCCQTSLSPRPPSLSSHPSCRYGIAHESQHLHLFLPDKGHSWLTSAAGSPVFFLLHGGFWKDKWHKYNTRTTTLVPDLLSRGFAVALVEYRRREAPGGGYPGTEEDCDAALRSLRLLPGIDLSRVVVMGHSAGAQLALAVCSRAEAASKQPPEEGGRGGEGGVVPCLCVAVAPPADMIPCHEARLSDERDAVERYLGCLPDSEAGRGVYQAASISPRRPSRVPVLLVAAGRDADVPPGLVRSFYSSWVEDVAAGEQKTVVPELLYLPLSDHYQAVTAGHPEWLSVARRTAAILQSVCGWSLPPHAPDYG